VATVIAPGEYVASDPEILEKPAVALVVDCCHWYEYPEPEPPLASAPLLMETGTDPEHTVKSVALTNPGFKSLTITVAVDVALHPKASVTSTV
jgi:hypothetical protein